MFDYILTNGLIADGSGAKPYLGSVCVKDGKIAKILSAGEALPECKTQYDVNGHFIAPGFMDIHTHSDYSYLADPEMKICLGSGITLNVIGNCGLSCIPVRDIREDYEIVGQSSLFDHQINRGLFDAYDVTSYGENIAKHGSTVNVGAMIGHGRLREYVIGWELRQLTPEELQEMCELADKLLSQGAIGISLGLIYAPGSFCETSELLALGKVVAKHNKIISVHMRNENDRIFEALDEMIYVARETGCRIEISHLKLMGTRQWGKVGQLLSKLEQARASGIRITADQYPYTSSHSGLASSFPVWSQGGGRDAMAERLKDDREWATILPEVKEIMASRGGADQITISETGPYPFPEIEGKTLPEVAEFLGMELMDAVRAIMIRCRCRIQCFYHNMSDEDVLAIMSRTDISVVSDGTSFNPAHYAGRPHPRNTGSAPRFLRLARENKLMPPELAITKLTSVPASVIGIADRLGYIKEGYDASITVFDWENVTDCATFREGTLASKGIDLVFVNGELVFDHGTFTGARPGKLITVY